VAAVAATVVAGAAVVSGAAVVGVVVGAAVVAGVVEAAPEEALDELEALFFDELQPAVTATAARANAASRNRCVLGRNGRVVTPPRVPAATAGVAPGRPVPPPPAADAPSCGFPLRAAVGSVTGVLDGWLDEVIAAHQRWTSTWEPFAPHPSTVLDEGRVAAALAELHERLEDNYPFFHPRYAGQMLKPPHPAAVAGYLAALLINPNNHALDGGPATAAMEREVVAGLAELFGFDPHLGHLTTSGTMANLEALFVARESHPGRGVAFSVDAHYTHARMAALLGLPAYPVAVDGTGRIDLEAVEPLVRAGRVGTVVLTAGTTGLGAVDAVDEALALKQRYGVRLHVDAAYGGFYTLLAGAELPAAPWRAVAACDSVVVDPHKHGLQPYGCGAVLFADPAVGRFYRHDSPYTYFTSDELHLGEISLECSRAGAAAAALWLTLRLLPLTADGLGAVLAPGWRAAQRWAELLDATDGATLYQRPALDIVTWFPTADTFSAVDARAGAVLRDGMDSGRFFLSTLAVTADALGLRHPTVRADVGRGRILRSVLMKPEAEDHLDRLHADVMAAVRRH